MHLRHLALIAISAAALIGGCRSARTTAPDTEVLQQVRQKYQAIDPDAKVGVIIATLPESGLVAVGEIPPAEVEEGQTLVLMDENQKIIGAGHVVAKTADALHLRYDVDEKADRQPEIGDLAVKAKQ